MKGTKPLLSTGNDIWTTPKEFYDKLNLEFNFDFDPCPIDPTFNGLEIEWGSSNFVNPPYSNLKEWAKKSIIEWRKGKTVVLLIPARTDTAAWHDYIMLSSDIRFIRGRLKFGGSKNPAPFPSAVVVFKGVKI